MIFLDSSCAETSWRAGKKGFGTSGTHQAFLWGSVQLRQPWIKWRSSLDILLDGVPVGDLQ
jgi:hypothetical protein